MSEKNPTPDEVFALSIVCPTCGMSKQKWCAVLTFRGLEKQMHDDRLNRARGKLADIMSIVKPYRDLPRPAYVKPVDSGDES